MKKIFLLAVVLSACAPVFAQQSVDNQINSLMGQYALSDVTNAYFTMLEYSYPERATRAGIDRANDRLDERTVAAEQKRRTDIKNIRDMLTKIKQKKLNQSEKTDYDVLARSLSFDYYLTTRGRTQASPLWYLAAQDAVYDVLLKGINTLSPYIIEPRVKLLPQVFKDGTDNIKGAYKSEAALAVNKAYAAFTSIGDMDAFLGKNAGDDAHAQLKEITDVEKTNLRAFFDKLKAIAKNAKPEPKKSPSYYEMILKDQIQLDQTPDDLTKVAEASLNKAKQNLLVMVKSFNLKKQTAEVKDFYTLAANVQDVPQYENLLPTVGEEIKKANKAMTDALPGSDMKVFVNHMPQYPSFLNPAYLFLPPYGIEHNLVGTLFIYTPPTTTNNPRRELDAFIKKNFTMPQIKLLVTESVVPGKQMFYSYSYNTKPIRRALASNAVLDGWSAYAKHLAYEMGYINTKEDVLFLAFDDYVRAVKALADLKLGTGALDYEETILFMMSQGISKDDAEIFTRQIAFNPGAAVGELRAYDEIKALRKKYKDAQGASFNLAAFHNNLFYVGKVPVASLSAELDYAYKNNKNMDMKNYTPKISY
ncbi:MAG: DUF885 domain-containing protein [Elusimicrobia bacterium]|nr:DUF885 domain-containing protein [Elusimicrobiota bacterium]